MNQTQKLGKAGEQLAAELLEAKGFAVVARNFRYRRSEIDLIAANENLLVFVEVKTRTNLDFGQPETFVTPNQRRQIHAAAGEYIHQTDWQHDIRFDIIAITFGQPPQLLHIEDAFY